MKQINAYLHFDGNCHPLKEEFFGLHGNLTDKYGVNWMLTHEPPRA